MKNAVRIFSVLAIISLAAFSPKNSELQSAPAQLDAMMASITNVTVIKDWGSCYQLSDCDAPNLYYADIASSYPLSTPNSYRIYYYTGGSCGIIVTDAIYKTSCYQ